jgi:hypothetical protein
MKYAFEISDVRGDYLRDCDFRRFAGTPLRLLVTGFVVLAAPNKCRMPCSNSSTATLQSAKLSNPHYCDGQVQLK